MLEKITEILADYKELEASDIKAETTLEDLGLDSLDTVELIMQFEDEFNVTIELNEELKTVADIVELIEKSK
ncbi:MAG: phosphopantetheine-binding protein [Bacillota bacterium]|jgi:acyl carrier protein